MNDFLLQMQTALDTKGQLIKFTDASYKPTSLKIMVRYAITYLNYTIPRTILIYPNNRKVYQKLGYTRSLEDLYRMASYYFPGTKIDEISAILYSFLKSRKLQHSWCYTYRKMMFQYGDSYAYLSHDIKPYLDQN